MEQFIDTNGSAILFWLWAGIMLAFVCLYVCTYFAEVCDKSGQLACNAQGDIPMTDINPALEAAIIDLRSLRSVIAILKEHYPEIKSVNLRSSVWAKIASELATEPNSSVKEPQYVDGLLIQPRKISQ